MSKGVEKWSFLHHVDWFNVGVGLAAFLYTLICIVLALSAVGCVAITVNSGSGSLDESKGAIIVKPSIEKNEVLDDQRRPDFRDR